MNTKIAGITRVRNEEHIIRDVLDHLQDHVDTVFVFDDFSGDNTVEICEAHPLVKKVIKGTSWASTPTERKTMEGHGRQIVYEEAVKAGYEWLYYFDADEFIFPFVSMSSLIKGKELAYRFRLFDFYITEEDKDLNYKYRKKMGPEYRDITMLFKARKDIRFFEREPLIKDIPSINRPIIGHVKHYGKAISIKEWEETCDYYVNNRGGSLFPKFTNKWRKRKGKAIHTVSDFGAELIKWEEREEKGFLLID